jgi:hypothetical protein
MNTKITILLGLFILSTFITQTAKASWVCENESSYRDGDLIMACGVANSTSENSARKLALQNAYTELDLVCSKSPDCNRYELIIKPQRTACNKAASGFICRRAIEIVITGTKRDYSVPRAYGDSLFIPIKRKIFQKKLIDNIQRALIDFKSSPSKVTVYVDGVELCKTPCSREIQHGKHNISYSKSDFDVWAKTLRVNSDTTSVYWQMKEAYGYLTVTNIPTGAKTKMDDLLVTKRTIKLKQGSHVLTVEHSDFQPFNKSFKIRKGQRLTISYLSDKLFGFLDISAFGPKGNAIRAEIIIDGKNTGKKTPAKIKVAAGIRKLKLTSGPLGNEKTISILPNKQEYLKLELINLFEDYEIYKKGLRKTNRKAFFFSGGFASEIHENDQTNATINLAYWRRSSNFNFKFYMMLSNGGESVTVDDDSTTGYDDTYENDRTEYGLVVSYSLLNFFGGQDYKLYKPYTDLQIGIIYAKVKESLNVLSSGSGYSSYGTQLDSVSTFGYGVEISYYRFAGAPKKGTGRFGIGVELQIFQQDEAPLEKEAKQQIRLMLALGGSF